MENKKKAIKKEYVHFKLTVNDKNRLKKECKRYNLTMSEYVTNVLFNNIKPKKIKKIDIIPTIYSCLISIVYIIYSISSVFLILYSLKHESIFYILIGIVCGGIAFKSYDIISNKNVGFFKTHFI